MRKKFTDMSEIRRSRNKLSTSIGSDARFSTIRNTASSMTDAIRRFRIRGDDQLFCPTQVSARSRGTIQPHKVAIPAQSIKRRSRRG